MKAKTTRRALLMSALSLLLCVSMLVGTTFAWFTDSVTSTGNKIVAGNLKVDLLMSDDEGTYASIAGEEAAIFGGENSLAAKNNAADTLWEPGKTQIVYLGVANKGNLDLKYNILLNVVDGGLIGSLEYAIVDGAKYDDITATSWAVLKADANAQTGDVAAGTTVAAPNGAIKAGEDAVDYFALAIHMKEEAGNQYQGKDITIDVTVLATQLASEEDSFDNQYDVNADFGVKVSTADEFVAALAKGGLIDVQDDITFTDGTSVVIPEGTVTTLSLNGHTLTNSVKAAPALVNNGTLTVNGGTIINENIEEQRASAIENHGTLVLNNVTAGSDLNRGAAVQNKGGDVTINGGFFATMTRAHSSNGYAYVFINNSGTMEINNAKVNGLPNGIFYADAGTIDVNGGTYIIKDGGNTWYVAYAGGDSQINLNSGVYKWYKLYCDAATTGNVVVSDECIINWGDNAAVVVSASTAAEANSALGKLADGKDVALVLTADVEISKIDLTGSVTSDVVIDAGGHKITTTESYGMEVTPGKNVTVSNADVEMTKEGDYITYAAGFKIANGDYAGATITLKNCTITMANTDWAYAVTMPAGVKNLNLVIDNCTLEGAIAVQCWGDNNTITITNSELICNYTTNAMYSSCCVALQSDGTNVSENNTLVIDKCDFKYSGVDNFNSEITDIDNLGTGNTVTVTNCTYDAKVVAN